MLGHEGASCETLTIKSDGPLNKIEASVVQEKGTLAWKLGTIRYVKSPNQKTYGEFLKVLSVEWSFEEGMPPIGLYGMMNPLTKHVVQLGFIQLDEQCQMNYEERGEFDDLNDKEL